MKETPVREPPDDLWGESGNSTSTLEAQDMQETNRLLSFQGTGWELFQIYWSNFWLKLLTLGIYHPWAKAKVLRYLYASTRLHDTDFHFHGNGRELFIGWVKALLALTLLEGIHLALSEQMKQWGIGGLPGELNEPGFLYWLEGLNLLVYFFMLFFVLMLAIVGVRRYRLSRTSWRGIRFRFSGTLGEAAKLMLKGWTLTILSLGLYYPFHRDRFQNFWVTRTRFGATPFAFDGEGRELFRIWLRGMLLSMLTLGIHLFWLRASMLRYFWGHTRLGEARIECTLRGGPLLKESAVFGFMLLISFGFARAWALERYNRFYLSNFSLAGSVDLSKIEQSSQEEGGAEGEGVASLLDLEM